MDTSLLQKTAQDLVTSGKGILAADSTEGTMDKRLVKVGIAPTPELRRDFRELLLTTEGIGEFIAGVILNDEIIRQKATNNLSFSDLVRKRGVLPGIKVDKKTHDMAGFPGEKIAEGLDDLRDRFSEYKKFEVVFTKFRAVITIGEGIPTQTCIDSNAEVLARYAALSQEAGLVPVVEPEVVMDGAHDIQRCYDASALALQSVFRKLDEHKVFLGGVLLKTNMVLPGKESGQQVSSEEVANKTLNLFKNTVPTQVAGVVFLSGGQSGVDANERLNEMNRIAQVPWQLSFSFERALQDEAMAIWQGKRENTPQAQKAFYKRARLTSLARQGRYDPEMENKNE